MKPQLLTNRKFRQLLANDRKVAHVVPLPNTYPGTGLEGRTESGKDGVRRLPAASFYPGVVSCSFRP